MTSAFANASRVRGILANGLFYWNVRSATNHNRSTRLHRNSLPVWPPAVQHIFQLQENRAIIKPTTLSTSDCRQYCTCKYYSMRRTSATIRLSIVCSLKIREKHFSRGEFSRGEKEDREYKRVFNQFSIIHIKIWFQETTFSQETKEFRWIFIKCS